MLPVLTREDLQEALSYAAWCLDEQEVPPALPEIGLHPPAFFKPHFATFSKSVPIAEPEAEADAQEGAAEESLDPAEAGALEETLESGSEEGPEESLELFHPSYPDQPTVVVTRHGLFDRRWGTHTIAWSDIREIQRKSSQKTLDIILHNPEFYLSSMPFLKRLRAQIKLAFNIQTLHLDTASLGIRTKDLYHTANRLWMRHRGKLRFRKKRRIRVNGKPNGSRSSTEWNRYQPM